MSEPGELDTATGEPPPSAPLAEHRLLPALVIVMLVVLPFLLPTKVFPRAMPIVAPLAVGLLIATIVADPGRIDRSSTWIRRLSIALMCVLVVMSTTAAVTLVVELVNGAPALASATTLLTAGALVWVDANLTFSLLYWEIDSGGPASRHHSQRQYPDLAFPEDMNPELARPGWRPTFLDYMYLSFTNATAFSPTDVMPLRHWAKLVMTAQATISIVILSLVIANAVNLLG
ncbi:MAG: DUF1345 domain-containing protein [Ilumatobacteraceae bacterium]